MKKNPKQTNIELSQKEKNRRNNRLYANWFYLKPVLDEISPDLGEKYMKYTLSNYQICGLLVAEIRRMKSLIVDLRQKLKVERQEKEALKQLRLYVGSPDVKATVETKTGDKTGKEGRGHEED